MAELRNSAICLLASMVGGKGVTNHGASLGLDCPFGSLSCQIFLPIQVLCSIKIVCDEKVKGACSGH